MADADNTPRKVKLTNNDRGPRFANTLRGQETVLPGATLTTEMTSAQLDALDDELVTGTEDVERWTIESADDDDAGEGDGGTDGLDKLSVTKLREIATTEGVELGEAKKAADIAKLIRDKRAAA